MTSLAADDPRHGTANGYNNLGCRCDECRNANTAYHRARKIGGYSVRICPGCASEMRTIARLCRSCYDAVRRAVHGTESRYNRGCRCNECRQAATVARARRRAKATA